MLLRIGDKIINRQKIYQVIDEALELRSKGSSQQDAANRVGLDRTVISKLESLGEIRKGGRIALVGFPIENCKELGMIAGQQGIDYCLLMSERERWDYVENKSGVQLFNHVMEIVAMLRQYDVVIMIGSNMRIKLMEALLDKEVIGIKIGDSPIAEDKYVEPEQLLRIVRQLQF